MNNATGNQATHCIFVTGMQVVNNDNQVAVQVLCDRLREMAKGNQNEAVLLPTVGIGNYALKRNDLMSRK
ncbi:MAG TPA: hypothetical protein DEH22_08505 [Chloroflexi bacterium]|nr:hypothetical protein [Chloroflexota bacterium]